MISVPYVPYQIDQIPKLSQICYYYRKMIEEQINGFNSLVSKIPENLSISDMNQLKRFYRRLATLIFDFQSMTLPRIRYDIFLGEMTGKNFNTLHFHRH